MLNDYTGSSTRRLPKSCANLILKYNLEVLCWHNLVSNIRYSYLIIWTNYKSCIIMQNIFKLVMNL